MKTVSEWLTEYDSHGIYEAVVTQRSFTEETGKTDVLPTHTVAETRKAINGDPRGGTVHGKGEERCVYGYEIALFLAQRYGSDSDRRYRQMMGRGFSFHAAIDSIRAAETAPAQA